MRYILHSKPKRYDDDGSELDSEDEDAAADEEKAEQDPYNRVIVQGLMLCSTPIFP